MKLIMINCLWGALHIGNYHGMKEMKKVTEVNIRAKNINPATESLIAL